MSETFAPRTLVVLLNHGEVQGGTDFLHVHRGDKVIFANAGAHPARITWRTNALNHSGSPFVMSADSAELHVELGHPLTMNVADPATAPSGRYTYHVQSIGHAASAPGPGVGDGGGGGEIMIQP